MLRAIYPFAFLFVLAAWVGAQGPATSPLTAADQIRLLRANRTLLNDLVDSGIKLGSGNHPLAKAEACRDSARALGIAMRKAVDNQDLDRVAELGDYLDSMMRDGLMPILDEAKRTIPPESPDSARLGVVRANAVDDLDWARSAIPPTGKLSENAQIKDICGKLDGLRERMK